MIKWIQHNNDGYLTNPDFPNWKVDPTTLVAVKLDQSGKVVRKRTARSLAKLKAYIYHAEWAERNL